MVVSCAFRLLRLTRTNTLFHPPHSMPHSQFKDYARDYIATHPECEKAAAARACQQQATAQQQQQRQPQA